MTRYYYGHIQLSFFVCIIEVAARILHELPWTTTRLLPPSRRLCFWLRLFVCQQDNFKRCRRILVTRVERVTSKTRFDFGFQEFLNSFYHCEIG